MSGEEKIQQALELLREASQEKRVELKQVIYDLFTRVKGIENAAADKIKQTASCIDESIHKKPWHYCITAALGGLVIGLFMRSKR